jgi:iron complex transport system ATP-binding protein
VIEARELDVSVGGRRVLREVSLEVRSGEVLALIGPNGAGKSTLLHALAGDVVPAAGSVLIGGRDITLLRPGALSRLRAVLPQQSAVSFPFLVREVVEMGRMPWARTGEAASDERAISDAVERAQIAHLLDRPFTDLSGGERARVALARVLAQATPVLLLDEPTAALDLLHQERVMRVAAQRAAEGAAVVVVLHDISLAAAWAHRIAVLQAGRIVRLGAPDEVLDPALLEAVYGLPVHVVDHPGGALVVPRREAQGA